MNSAAAVSDPQAFKWCGFNIVVYLYIYFFITTMGNTNFSKILAATKENTRKISAATKTGDFV